MELGQEAGNGEAIAPGLFHSIVIPTCSWMDKRFALTSTAPSVNAFALRPQLGGKVTNSCCKAWGSTMETSRRFLCAKHNGLDHGADSLMFLMEQSMLPPV